MQDSFPEAARQARSWLDDGEGPGPEYAFAVIPNISPGGATTEADTRDLDRRDPHCRITDADGPSIGSDPRPMAYIAAIDELYTWDPVDGWVLWNY